MRDAVEQHDPPVGVASVSFPGPGDMDDMVLAEAAGAGNGQGTLACFDGEDPSRGARGVFET